MKVRYQYLQFIPFLFILSFVVIIFSPSLLNADWYIKVPAAAQRQVGTSRLGPYQTRAQAQTVNQQYFNGRATITGSDNNTGNNGIQQSKPNWEEQQRQQEEAKRQAEIERREEAEQKAKQEQFEKDKQNALNSMKGISGNEMVMKSVGTNDDMRLKGVDNTNTSGPGLKDTTATNAVGLKDVGDFSVVDLWDLGLDPNKPTFVDPHVVKGEERVFPVQIDPKTLENANYNKGFEELMQFDVASAAAAVKYFKEAQKERPHDSLVRNGLLLAQDILAARQKKEQDNEGKAVLFTLQSYAALQMGDNETAKNYIAQARKLDPNNKWTRFVESIANLNIGPEGTYPERKAAYRLVADSLIPLQESNYAAAIAMVEAAQKLQTRDRTIAALLTVLRKQISLNKDAKLIK